MSLNKNLRFALFLSFLMASSTILVEPISGASAQDAWVIRAPMDMARSELGAATINYKLYAIGGVNENFTVVGSNEIYNPSTDTWTALAPMLTPRVHFGITSYQNKIFVIGGITSSMLIPWTNMRAISGISGINEVY